MTKKTRGRPEMLPYKVLVNILYNEEFVEQLEDGSYFVRYSQLATRIGISRDRFKEAVVRLEQLGLLLDVKFFYAQLRCKKRPERKVPVHDG